MFPIRPVPENDVRKPDMFVFKDMDDYAARGGRVDEEYAKLLAERAKRGGGHTPSAGIIKPVVPPPAPKPVFVVPADVVGKQVRHKVFGLGQITGISGTKITISFDSGEERLFGYEVCIKNKFIEFV